MDRCCSVCGIVKPLAEFNKGQKRCRPCDIQYLREWRAKNKERAREIVLAYRARQMALDPIGYAEKEKRTNNKYRQNNPEKVKETNARAKKKSRTRISWRNMLNRCLHPREFEYAMYGARGITVCERWLIYENFFADMGECPPKLTLDRINNDLGYHPGNCRWATQAQQARNKRTNRVIEFNGERKVLKEWAETIGVSPNTLTKRLLVLNWSVEKALTTKPDPRFSTSR